MPQRAKFVSGGAPVIGMLGMELYPNSYLVVPGTHAPWFTDATPLTSVDEPA